MAATLHTFKDFEFPWTRGRTLKLKLTVLQSQDGADLTADNVGDGEVWVTGKTSLADEDANALFRLNFANEGVGVLNAAAGTVLATVPPEATVGLPDKPTPVYVDCVRVTPTGERYSFRKGTVTFHPSGEETLAT
jgi:hypothetical protein